VTRCPKEQKEWENPLACATAAHANTKYVILLCRHRAKYQFKNRPKLENKTSFFCDYWKTKLGSLHPKFI
jgi:hypothetical protein